MAKKFHYFDLNGLGEAIRLILHYAEEKFEDVRYDLKSWPVQSVKESLPYGQLPLYEEGNRSLNQSLAIARYLASKTGLLPSDSWEQALLDAAVFNVYDFWAKAKPIIYLKDPEQRAAMKKEILEEIVPFFFSRFEKELQSGNGYFGGKLSWADFMFVGIIETANLFLEEVIEKDYPTVVALVKKIYSLPGVQKYLATRKTYEKPEL